MFTHHVTMKVGLEYRMAYDQKIKSFVYDCAIQNFLSNISAFKWLNPVK